jgi:hypothetical protein
VSDPQYQAPRSHAVPGIAHDQRYSVDQSELRIGALIALRVSPALGGDKGWRPFPRTPFSASSILPSLRFGQVSLDEAEHFLHNRDASVATLRWCSGSSRNAVRIHPGFSVRLHRNPHLGTEDGVLVCDYQLNLVTSGRSEGGQRWNPGSRCGSHPISGYQVFLRKV